MFYQNLMKTINQYKEENEKLNDKRRLLETENKILKDDIVIKQKLIYYLLQHNNLLITQQDRLTTELLTRNSENGCKETSNDEIHTEKNNIRQEEVPSKPEISKADI